MAIKIQFDEAELKAAVKAHLKAKIPTADASTVQLNIVAGRQPTGPYAEVDFEFECFTPQTVSDEEIKVEAPAKTTPSKKTFSKKVVKEVVVTDPEDTVITEDDTPPFDPADEIETSEEEDAADDAEEEDTPTETKPRKKLFGKA